MRGKIRVLVRFLRMKIGKLLVTLVFQNQRLSAVADDNPIARAYAGFFHDDAMNLSASAFQQPPWSRAGAKNIQVMALSRIP